MTVENCIIRYKKYVKDGNTEAATDMKKHMLNPLSRKFKGHPFLKELGDKPEVKPLGKKPKG